MKRLSCIIVHVIFFFNLSVFANPIDSTKLQNQDLVVIHYNIENVLEGGFYGSSVSELALANIAALNSYKKYKLADPNQHTAKVLANLMKSKFNAKIKKYYKTKPPGNASQPEDEDDFSSDSVDPNSVSDSGIVLEILNNGLVYNTYALPNSRPTASVSTEVRFIDAQSKDVLKKVKCNAIYGKLKSDGYAPKNNVELIGKNFRGVNQLIIGAANKCVLQIAEKAFDFKKEDIRHTIISISETISGIQIKDYSKSEKYVKSPSNSNLGFLLLSSGGISSESFALTKKIFISQMSSYAKKYITSRLPRSNFSINLSDRPFVGLRLLAPISIDAFCKQEKLRGVFFISIGAPEDIESDSRESNMYFHNCFTKTKIKSTITLETKLREKIPFENSFKESLKNIVDKIAILK